MSKHSNIKIINESDSDDNEDSSDDEEEPIDKITPNHIKVETTTMSTVYYQYLQRNSINLEPSYQRSLIWSHEKMLLFLDSVYYCPIIPSFILYTLSKKELELLRKEKTDSVLQFECIDGQHRLTVIKHFMESKMIRVGEQEKYLFILEKKISIKKNNQIKIFYKVTKEIEHKFGKKNIREMTMDEKTDFENTQLSFLRINTPLTNNAKCTLFNRLQNGEKVSSVIKFKNFDHPITNYLREKNIVSNALTDEWKKIIQFNNGFGTDRKSRDKFLSKMTFMICRLLLMTDKKTLDVNYLDINIKKYIERNTPASQISSSINLLYIKINETKDKIKKILKTKIIIEEFYYLLNILITNNEKIVDLIPKLITDTKTFDKFNNCAFYKDKDKVLGKESMNQKYKELIEYMQKLQNKTQQVIMKDKGEDEDEDEDVDEDEGEIIVPKLKQGKKYNRIKV